MKGQSVCRMHGAGGNALTKTLVANTKHGRYSTTNLPLFLASYERFNADPNALDLSDEIAISRAALNALMEEAHNDPTIGPFAVMQGVESLAKVVGAESKRRGVVSQNHLTVFIARVADVFKSAIYRNVTDQSQQNAIWADVRHGLAGIFGAGAVRPDTGPDATGD